MPAPAPVDEPLRPRAWLTALLCLGGALIVIAGTLRLPWRWGDPYDWRYFQAIEEVFRLTVADYHQVPLWNPYICGGEVGLANPFRTLTFDLSLLREGQAPPAAQPADAQPTVVTGVLS